MGQCNFKKPFEFHNFSEIFYSSVARLKKMNLRLFMQCQITILRNKNTGQSLFKKHSTFRSFDEIFYCDMTWLRNTNFDVLIQRQYTRAILRKKNMGQSLFKKHSKFPIFNKVGTINRKLLKNIIINKRFTSLRKKTRIEDNFKKCSRCRRFSQIFQCVINRRMNTNSRIFG